VPKGVIVEHDRTRGQQICIDHNVLIARQEHGGTCEACVERFPEGQPAAVFERSTTLVVPRAKQKRGVPPPATKLIISAPGSEPLEAVVMSAGRAGLGELTLVLEGVSSHEVPEGAEVTWWG